MLYLLKNSFASLIRNPNYHYHVVQPPGFNLERLQDLIEKAHKRLERVQIECLPYGNGAAPASEPAFEADPTIAELIDISTDSDEQLGFAILRKDNSLEIVDAVTGQHTRLTFGKPKPQPKDGPTAQA